MNKSIYIITFFIICTIIVVVFVDFNKEKKDMLELNKNSNYIYLIKDKPAEIESFLPDKIDKDMIFTYKVKDKDEAIKTIINIPSKNQILYINVKNDERKIPIPKIDKISYDFIFNLNKITECELTDYVPNMIFFKSTKTTISIFCKSDDQKISLSLTLVENIGLISFQILEFDSGHHDNIYSLAISSVKNSDKEISGDNLFAP